MLANATLAQENKKLQTSSESDFKVVSLTIRKVNYLLSKAHVRQTFLPQLESFLHPLNITGILNFLPTNSLLSYMLNEKILVFSQINNKTWSD